jgi:hypothetical protein
MDAENLSPRHIQAVPDDAVPDQVVPDQGAAAADSRRPIGEIFVALGFISRAELHAALDVQRTTGGRIGEILVGQGRLSRMDLASALAEHWEPHPYTGVRKSLASPADSAASNAAGEPEPQPAGRPQRDSRLQQARGDALQEQLAQLEARLRAEHDRALEVHAHAVTRRLETIETRIDEIGTLEARLEAVSDLAEELRGELTSLAQQRPPADPSARLRELSLRIDRAARESHDRISALATDLRTELAVKSAGLDARLQAQLDDASASQRRFAELQDAATAALADSTESAADLHAELGSLAGRLDELYGLRHADLKVGRAANERLSARLDDLVARREAERADAGEETRAAELAVLEALGDLGRQLTAMGSKKGKRNKRLRSSIDSLTAAIAAVDARLAERAAPSDPEL